jgi:hypothetical protein
MNKQQFSSLLLVTIVLLLAVILLVPGKPETPDTKGKLLLEGLGQAVNDVNKLVVSAGSSSDISTLVRNGSGWSVAELHGYPADFERLRILLAALAESRVLEPKTSNPQYYARLGVEDPDSEGALSTQVVLHLPDRVYTVIIGNSAASGQGHYARLAGNAQSVLLDRALEADADPLEWADRTIIDIGSALVAEVKITHPDGDYIQARKISADETDFSLVNIPSGRELVSSWSVNSLANILSGLDFDSVEPADDSEITDAVRVELLTFSGTKISIQAIEKDDSQWVRLEATDRAVEAESGASAEESEAERINRRVSSWSYRIPASKFEAMSRRLEQLLKKAEDGSA